MTVFIETAAAGDGAALSAELVRDIKNVFEVSAEVDVLARGTLAAEFESSVKAQRFLDKRG